MVIHKHYVIEKGGPGSGRKKNGYKDKETATHYHSEITSDILDDIKDFKKKDTDLRSAALGGKGTFGEQKKYRKDKLKELSSTIISAPEPELEDMKDKLKDVQKWASNQRIDNMKQFSGSRKDAIDDQELKEIENILRNAERYVNM